MKRISIVRSGLTLAILLLCAGCQSAPPAPAEATPPASETPAAPTPTPEGPTDEEIARKEIEGLEDSRLWLRVQYLEEDADAVLLGSEETGDGIRVDTYLYEDTVRVAVERVRPVDGDGDMPEEIVARTAVWEGLGPSEIEIEEDEAAGNELTYPAYRLFYKTGSGESAMWNVDLYVQTDPWDFRVHTATPIAQEEEYIETIITWFYFVEWEE